MEKNDRTLGPVDVARSRVRLWRGSGKHRGVHVAIGEPLMVWPIGNTCCGAFQSGEKRHSYAGSAGPITVTDAVKPGSRHCVTDSGPVFLRRTGQIFTPFYRLEASRNREQGGAGLGLAIVKSSWRRAKARFVAGTGNRRVWKSKFDWQPPQERG